MTPEPLWEITYEDDGSKDVVTQSHVELMLRFNGQLRACRARLVYAPLRLRLRRRLRLARERLTEWVGRM